MLASLTIRNLALVEDLAWEPGAGLNALTGETGAGKSMVIGALQLLLGQRAQKGLIRSGADSCEVSALFQPTLELAARLAAILDEAGLPLAEDGLLVRRQLREGGGRQWVNDAPATVGLLERLGAELVDLHGPHDHQSLFSRERQRELLDAFGKLDDKVRACAAAHTAWRAAARVLEEARREGQAGAAEVELLRHRLGEIEAAQLVAGEDRELEERHGRARNAARLAEASGRALGLLRGDEDGVLGRLAEVQRLLRELERLDPAVSGWLGGFEGALVELDELAASLEGYAGELGDDPAEVARLEARYDLLEGLKRKYGPSLEEVIASGVEAQARLERLENRDANLGALEAAEAAARQRRDQAALALSQARRAVAPRLGKEVARQLQDLGFARSHFEIRLERLAEPAAAGIDAVEFQFGPNPGEPPKPLRQVASSGEASRVMLALKSALAQVDPVALLVFDEIDANVGGEVAVAVGAKLAELGRSRQVVAITHFPQVASLAGEHFVVRKEVDGGHARTRLERLERAQRVGELTRMLGGESKSARAHAEELLGR